MTRCFVFPALFLSCNARVHVASVRSKQESKYRFGIIFNQHTCKLVRTSTRQKHAISCSELTHPLKKKTKNKVTLSVQHLKEFNRIQISITNVLSFPPFGYLYAMNSFFMYT